MNDDTGYMPDPGNLFFRDQVSFGHEAFVGHVMCFQPR